MPAQVDRLLRVRAAIAKPVGSANVRELLRAPADAEPGDQAAAGQGVERRELLREDDRVAHRDDDHAGPEANLAGAPGRPGEGRDGLVDPAVVLLGGVVDEEVVGRPDVGEAVRLRELDRRDHALEVRVVAERREHQSVVHRGHRTGIRPPRPEPSTPPMATPPNLLA